MLPLRSRLEICCDRHGQLCKFFQKTMHFLAKLFGKFTHTFSPKLLKFYICTSISTTKKDQHCFYQNLVWLFSVYDFGPKIWSFKFFDKFHVWVNEQLVNQHQYQHWKKVERGSGGGGDKDPKKMEETMKLMI